MSFHIPNMHPNLTVIRRTSDGAYILVPILYWAEFGYGRVPVDLSRMRIEISHIIDADFAVHDASDGRVYLRDGSIYETLAAFEEASR
jgi:hypothetical protein